MTTEQKGCHRHSKSRFRLTGGSGAYGKAGTVMTAAMGALILAVGFYMFWLAF
jgi:hypothetical protein